MLDNEKFKRNYLIGAVIVWVAIIIASAVVLAGTPYMAQMLSILAGGAVWFVILVPGAFFWNRQKPS